MTVLEQNKVMKARSIKFGNMLLEGKTIRDISDECNFSRSTIHTYLTKRLKDADIDLYKKVIDKLKYNKAVRHIRGGEATRERWQKLA